MFPGIEPELAGLVQHHDEVDMYDALEVAGLSNVIRPRLFAVVPQASESLLHVVHAIQREASTSFEFTADAAPDRRILMTDVAGGDLKYAGVDGRVRGALEKEDGRMSGQFDNDEANGQTIEFALKNMMAELLQLVQVVLEDQFDGMFVDQLARDVIAFDAACARCVAIWPLRIFWFIHTE